MAHKFKKHFSSKKRYMTALLVVLLLVLMFLLELTNTTYLFHKQKTVSVVIPTTSTSTKAPADSTTSTQPPQTTSAKTPAVNSSSNLPLVAPYGSFVSNHSPSLSGNSVPSSEQSSCYTTPGATCYIVFTKDSITNRLPDQVANSYGIAYWSWDIKQAGMTQGSWQIQAIATLNGQTKSTLDTINLDVQP